MTFALKKKGGTPSFNFVPYRAFYTKTATLWRQLKFAVPSIYQSESVVKYWSTSVFGLPLTSPKSNSK